MALDLGLGLMSFRGVLRPAAATDVHQLAALCTGLLTATAEIEN